MKHFFLSLCGCLSFLVPAAAHGQYSAPAQSRTIYNLIVDQQGPAVTEGLPLTNMNQGGVYSTNVISIGQIPTGQTWHIQSISASYVGGSTANNVRVRLRAATTGNSCGTSSGVIWQTGLSQENGTAATSAGFAFAGINPVEDLQIPGGMSPCITMVGTAASGFVNVSVVGYLN